MVKICKYTFYLNYNLYIYISKIKHDMELFDVIKVMFEKPGDWVKVTENDKKRHFFMINRYMSINYPLQASVLQTQKINPAEVVNFWQRYMQRLYPNRRTPSWIYTKGAKKAKEKKEKSLSITDKLIKEYSFATQQDLKSVYDAIHFFPEKMINEIKDYEKSLKLK